MAVRQHKPVAIRPDRVLRIKIHHAIPDRVNQWRERHGRAGVTRFRRLNRVNGEGANCIDGQLFYFFITHKFYFRYLMFCAASVAVAWSDSFLVRRDFVPEVKPLPDPLRAAFLPTLLASSSSLSITRIKCQMRNPPKATAHNRGKKPFKPSITSKFRLQQ